MIQITEIEKDIFEYIEKGNYRKPAALLSDLLKRLEITQIDSFVDTLSRVLKTKKGPKIAKAFIRLNRKIKDKNKLYETELILIKKHMLIDEECLIDSFFGTLESGFETVKGRIFLTNYRIIASGYQKEKAAPHSGGPRVQTPSKIRLVSNLAKDIKDTKKFVTFLKGIRISMNFGFYSEDQIQYGAYYPLSYPNEIDVSTRSLKFSTTEINEYIGKFSYLSDYERVFISNKIQITRKRLSNESREEFQANLAKSYELIKKALKMAKISDIGASLDNFFKKNQGKAWTAKAILNRVDELNLKNNVKREVTEKMILETLDRLYNEGFINRNIHEDQFFYYL